MSHEKVKLCELCEEEAAATLCLDCYKCYCDKCSKFVHGLTKKKEHRMEPVRRDSLIDTMCHVHKNNPLEFFCVDDSELCCGACTVRGPHAGHRIIEISEALKDDSVCSVGKINMNFAKVVEQSTVLEEKIVEAIDYLQKEGTSVKEKVTQTFKEAHEKLSIEEASIMKQLECTCKEVEERLDRAREELRVRLEHCAVLMSAGEGNETEEANKLGLLNIVSKKEREVHEMEKLMRTLIIGVKIGWDSKKRKLSFTQDLVNEIAAPTDFRVSTASGKSVDASWSFDETGLSEEDKKGLTYCVEMKRASESKKRRWEEAYTGKDKKCVMKGFDASTDYNFRVRCTIGKLEGNWSEIAKHRIKKVLIDSTILSKEANKEVFEEKLSEWCGTTNFELLYRGTRDGFGAGDFHRECDDKGKTLVLIKNTSRHVFGGFASVPWMSSSSGAWKPAPGSFLFTLTNMHGIQPTKFPLKNENDKNAIYHRSDRGPSFGGGHDIFVSSGCDTETGSYGNFPYTYNDTTGKGKGVFSSYTNTQNFQVQEIEVFKV